MAELFGPEMGKMISHVENKVDDSVNLRSPSLSVSESGNEELCSELSPDVDGVSDSSYTSSTHKTDGQHKVSRGLPSNDNKKEKK